MADSDLPPPQTLSPIYNNGLAWCGDGSFVFPVSDSKSYGSLRTNNSLWRIRVNLSNGQAAGKPERFTADSPDTIWNLTCTESGKRLSFVKSYSWADVYVAELGPDGTSIKPPRRLTFDNRGSSANAWTRDSRNILFESERNGTNQIFRQAIGSNSAELVAWGPRELSDGDLTPDRKWVLFRETESKDEPPLAASTV